MKKFPRSVATTKLERAVARIMNRHAVDYDTGVKGVYADLQHGGCISGLIGELVYYHDTVRFFKAHRSDINALLADLIAETGEPVESLLRDWDTSDPLAHDTQNQNLLAWFGFEGAARMLAARAGIDD